MTGQARILLVDDVETFRKPQARMLANHGYVVSEAANGIEALQAISKQPTDLVLLDIIMPEMEGIETIRAIHSKHPAIKIIAMSGGGRICADDYLKIAAALGVEKTLAKPFTSEELINAVEQVLKID